MEQAPGRFGVIRGDFTPAASRCSDVGGDKTDCITRVSKSERALSGRISGPQCLSAGETPSYPEGAVSVESLRMEHRPVYTVVVRDAPISSSFRLSASRSSDSRDKLVKISMRVAISR